MPRKPRTTTTNRPGEWATVAQAAAHLQVHPNTIRRLIKSGRLPAIRVGQQIRIDLARAELGTDRPGR